jgi:hypothetical protein
VEDGNRAPRDRCPKHIATPSETVGIFFENKSCKCPTLGVQIKTMKTLRLHVRLAPSLFKAVRDAAKQSGKTSSEFTRLMLERNQAVRKILTSTEPKGTDR